MNGRERNSRTGNAGARRRSSTSAHAARRRPPPATSAQATRLPGALATASRPEITAASPSPMRASPGTSTGPEPMRGVRGSRRGVSSALSAHMAGTTRNSQRQSTSASIPPETLPAVAKTMLYMPQSPNALPRPDEGATAFTSA